MTDSPQASASDQNGDALKAKRKKLLSIFALVVIVAAIVFGIWYVFFNHTVNTDNAYVGADTAQITSMVTGQVSEILVNDTQQVHKGDILVKIDPRDAEIALAEAKAMLAKAQRTYRQTAANGQSLNAQVQVSDDGIASAQAQVLKAQADYNNALEELKRRQVLSESGAISKEELSTAQTAARTAKAALDVAKAALSQSQSNRNAAQSTFDATQALIKGTSEASAPDVLSAQTQVQKAQLDLDRTVIRATVDGVIAGRSIQVGQRVAPGTVLMKVVPVSQLYVDANFKESQLTKVRVGQAATLTSDLYGDDVVYYGKVIGFSGGTGSAFALIPAQNATGNWIKVVQRLPVRIALDPNELKQHPLRVGLSMEATIDLSKK
ncbi:HlyD family secretion protein [Acinetobacter soli]|uniref:HlyD family efflux transporter periplasmic adaptor subunit n=1 Tax=Acinetobacter soli TaxID=487316 RepID=A0AB38YWK5_9GAMM|nr:HlyD family efflux transporter periplasmic adaptor subunit [Acinetobacter soli]KQD05758.1 hemolysin D [Acinetobacter soli]WEH92295.1 HlyD family efflux transporter periplasmic adaptor subunit [Acinetobacter soli]WEH98541.1 HlyD family efflux transporter periplasmic adaptor subunit [Acinetobacter soli]WEI00860.1 HlyD family efflux transporter periplasmic adaptor subunit [Acinetobacter soli]WND05625.1 HlyD family efflux transporter periplasmic adaptor subunit [Acinetobacter soli]